MEEKEAQKKIIASRIKSIRNDLGLTMREFGKRFDPPASDSIVSRWERGISSPNNKRLKRIAELGNISMMYLTTGNKAMYDLTEDEKTEEMKQGIKKMVELQNDLQNNLKVDIESLLNKNMNTTETIYLAAVMDFLKFSSPEDVKYLSSIIVGLSRHKGIGDDDDVTQSELLEFIEGETENFKEFLKQRFNYKEGE